jgi:hypothetical protein
MYGIPSLRVRADSSIMFRLVYRPVGETLEG